MDRQRVLELALQELQRQKMAVEEEIKTLQSLMESTGAIVQPTGSRAAITGRGRKRTSDEKAAQAQRMREYWAKRRAQATKPVAATKPSGTAKVQSKTGAQKKALSLAMKKAWAKRKAAAAQRAKESKG